MGIQYPSILDTRYSDTPIMRTGLTKREYYDTFKLQEHIGWTQFSQGLISTQWAALQQKFYHRTGNRRSGKVWAAQLINQLWDLNFHIWNFRNTQLHANGSLLEDLHGKSHLDIAIKKELCQGKGKLPPTFFPLFFKYSAIQLMALPLDSQIQWFRTIRTAREDTGTDIQDVFSLNKALRKWVGLRPT